MRAGRTQVNRERQTREDVFRIEDEDDEEGDGPPAYDDVNKPLDRDNFERDETGDRGKEDGEVDEVEEEVEDVEVRHPVSRGDTILSIARRYGADVSRFYMAGM